MPNYSYDHIHLTSPDPAKTAQFYEEMFGAKRGATRNIGGGRTTEDLDLNGTKILIMTPASRPEAASGSK